MGNFSSFWRKGEPFVWLSGGALSLTLAIAITLIVVVIINNGYLSLIRQNQRYAYEYEYGVDLTYDGLGVDFVRLAEAFGAYGERVTEPGEIRNAFERAVNCGKPAVVDVIVERETDAAMGASLDAIREFE